MSNVAFITGITGQDGSYLAEHLLELGYEVHGLVRKVSHAGSLNNISHIQDKIHLHTGSLNSLESMINILQKVQPTEIYNLAAQSIPEYEYIPLLSAQKIFHKTFGELWRDITNKTKPFVIDVNGVSTEVVEPKSPIKALGMWNGMGTWFRIKQVTRHKWNAPVAILNQKFGQVSATPNHCLLDTNQQRCQASDNPWLLNIRKLNYNCARFNQSIKLKTKGQGGENIETKDYANLCKFIGAFVTEGSSSYNKANRSYTVSIANQDKKWLESIQEAGRAIFQDLPFHYTITRKGNYAPVSNLCYNNKALYTLLRSWCGVGSRGKCLPEWVFQVPKEAQQLLFDTMIEGDGCRGKWGWRYTTSSRKLAAQVSLLITMLGYDYTVDVETTEFGDTFHFRECSSYQPTQGASGKTVQYKDYEGWVYDISVEEVENFAVGVGNIVVHNSHVATSYDIPIDTADMNFLGFLRILEAARLICPNARIYQACHDTQTSIVSQEGIKSVDEVQEGDLVYTINEVTREVELKPIKAIHRYNYSGPMVFLKSKKMSQLVTPHHRVLLQKENKLVGCKASSLKDILHSHPSPYNHTVPRAKRKMVGLDPEVIKFEEIIHLRDPKYNTIRNTFHEMLGQDLFFILGLYIGDGYIKKGKKAFAVDCQERHLAMAGNSGNFAALQTNLEPREIEHTSNFVEFAIPEGDKSREELLSTLERCGISYHATPLSINFSSVHLVDILRTAGVGVENKIIPQWVYNYPTYLPNLLRGMLGSDGHTRRTSKTLGSRSRFTYTTVSNKLAAGLIGLLSYLGYHCNLTKVKPRDGYSRKLDRVVRSKRQSYVVSWSEVNQPNKLNKTLLSEIDYSGEVWCLEMEGNANFLIEREGRIVFSGNSTSEMFGRAPAPQGEDTPFAPTSTYSCAKIASYYQAIHHREAFGMFVAQGILFNHETIAGFEPVIFKVGSGPIDIKPISEVVRNHSGVKINEQVNSYQEGEVTNNLFLWDSNGWTKVKFASGYPHKKDTDNKKPRYIVSKNASFMGTGSHPCIMEDLTEKPFENLEIGDKINLTEYPISENVEDITLAEAELIGLLVGDGSVSSSSLKFTNSNSTLRKRVEELWKFIGGDSVYYYPSKSGFTGKVVGQIVLNGNKQWVNNLDLYTEDRKKRVPMRILNSSEEVQLAFLKGYNQADGLKANKCTYEFKNFKTNSATLAAGLVYLVSRVTGQNFTINIEQDMKWGNETLYYSINLMSMSNKSLSKSLDKANTVKELVASGTPKRAIARETGISRKFVNKVVNGYSGVVLHHNQVEDNVVKKIIELPDYTGWFYDLETESGTFHCGVGRGHVHNSPRRPESFVTRKITKAAARIALGLQDELRLGNLETGRDWGYAKDYCINKDVPILTTDGWKDFYEMKEGDSAITFNIEKDCIELDTVLKVHDLKSDGYKIRIKGRGVDFTCTPNHRIIYQSKSTNSKGGWSRWKETTALDFHKILSEKQLRGRYDYRLPHFQDYLGGPNQENKDKIYLVGALLAEGCLTDYKQGRGDVVESEIINDGVKEVWCITTKNGTIISRDKDSLMISGNCKAMRLILQHSEPTEFVIATGVCTTLQDFLGKAFSYFNLNWRDYVIQDPKFMRPQDHHELRGDYSKAKALLGWEPETSIDQLVQIMCKHDYEQEKERSS